MDKNLFKELSKDILKKHSKRYANKYFTLFLNYLDKNNLKNTDYTNQNLFNEYFEDLLFSERMNFKNGDKLELLKRSGGCCSICGVLTIFPNSNRNKSVVFGEACHIKPASRKGPRSNEKSNINIEEIQSIENGIWACSNCHKKIDTDPDYYTISYLQQLKEKHESYILDIANANPPINIRNIIELLEISNNNLNIYIKKEFFDNIMERNFYLNNRTEELYSQLLEIQKKSIENLSAFKLLNESNNKLYNQFGNYKLDMSPNHLNLICKQENIKDVNSAFEEFKKTNKFDKYSLNIIEKDVKINMVNELSDHNKDFEFFIINKENSHIIKFKFLELKFNFNDKEEKITLIKKNFIININKKDNITNIEMYHPINHNLQYYLINEFCFINQIENFDIRDFFLMIRYKKNIYKVHLENLTPTNS